MTRNTEVTTLLRRALSAARHPVRSLKRLASGPAAPTAKSTPAKPKPAGRGTFAASKLTAWIESDFAAPQESLGIDAGITIPRRSLREGRYLLPEFIAHDGYAAPDRTVAFATTVTDETRMGVEALLYSLQQVYPTFDSDLHVFHDDGLAGFTIDRLTDLYPRFVFHAASAPGFTDGALGLTDYDRVIVIDPDALVVGDISPLWTGSERPKAVADAGTLPFALLSEATGRPAFNSAVLSLPRSARGPQATARAVEFRRSAETAPGRQAFWNAVLSDADVELLPTTFNASARLVESYFPDSLGAVSVLRYSGVKPWFDYLPTEEKTADETKAHAARAKTQAVTLGLWRKVFGQGVRRARVGSFERSQGAALETLRDSASGRPAVMIGNGPSISKTDLSLFEGFEKYAFNWFINHPDFDEVRPDHLVLASAKFFGGWHTARPTWPAGYLDALLARAHKPRLWVAYYFKNLIDSTPQLAGYDVSYFLFEKPIKPMLQKTGTVALDLSGPLSDSLTGVLSAGVPIAVHLGATSVALVGCDSNYANETGSYFYEESKHTSPTNTSANLVSTWGSAASVGQYCYLRFAEQLGERGIRFVDSTIDGALRTVPKLPIGDVRSLLTSAQNQ